jgi:hypothetical protein
MRTEAAVALRGRTTPFAALSESTLRALADRAVQWSYPRLTPFQVKTVLLALAANAASDGSG